MKHFANFPEKLLDIFHVKGEARSKITKFDRVDRWEFPFTDLSLRGNWTDKIMSIKFRIFYFLNKNLMGTKFLNLQ